MIVIGGGGSSGSGSGISPEQAGQISQQKVNQYSTGVATFADLRMRTPQYDGERVLLKSHTAPTVTNPCQGGGEFIGYLSAKADDGGMVASSGGAYHWNRAVSDLTTLDVTHFGAIEGGVVPADSAMIAMNSWAQANLPTVGIKFPAGTFLVNGVDFTAVYLSYFRMYGSGNPYYGYYGTTKLVSNKGTGFMVKVRARRVELASLNVDGENNVTPNTKGFFQNTQTEGQYDRITMQRWTNMGGMVIDLVDTLDTKIDQFYASQCHGGVFNIAWSNINSWDHSTALEFANFNIQSCNVKEVFNVQRAGQSIMHNGWVEKCDYQGTLANGQWIFNAVSCEGNQNQWNCSYTRAVLIQQNINNSSSIPGAKPGWSFADDPAITANLSAYERGQVFINNHGIDVAGSLSYDYLSSRTRMNNTTAAAVWYKVGKFTVTTASDLTSIRLIGADAATNSATGLVNYGDNNFDGGEAIIRLRKPPGVGNKHDLSVEVHGRSPVLDVRVEKPYDNDVAVYVQLRPNSGWVNAYVETTCNNRYQAGTRFLWTWFGTVITDTDFALLTTFAARRVAAFGTIWAGIAFKEDGEVVLQTSALIDGNRLKARINGAEYLIPVELAPIGSDAFTRTGALVASSADNALGGTLNATWAGAGTGATAGNNTASGQLIVTTTASASVCIDTATANAKASFRLVSGPSTLATTVDATFDFRKATSANTADKYAVQMMQKTGGITTLRMILRLAGVVTTISPNDITCSDGDTIAVSYLGTTIALIINGVEKYRITDSSLSAGSFVGFSTGTANTGFTISRLKIESA